MTSIRMAQLVPMDIICPWKKHPSLKIIVCPMAFGELSMNFIMLFKVLADSVILSHVSRNEWSITSAKRSRRGLSTQAQTRSSLCICVSFIKQVNSPWHLLSESLNKNTTEEKSVKPVALTYLTVVVWAEQWELEKAVSVFFFLTVASSPFHCFSILCFAAFCKSQHTLKQQKSRK